MEIWNRLKEMALTIVRHNLMTKEGYTPYCGSDHCTLRWPRTTFNGNQFTCSCGWTSQFDSIFIQEYKLKWNYM